MSNELPKFTELIALKEFSEHVLKKSDAFHQHGQYPTHPASRSHRDITDELGIEINADHIANLPHIHDEDKKLIMAMKQKLATNKHNKGYWKARGADVHKKIEMWKDLLDRGDLQVITSAMRSFASNTGFDLKDMENYVHLARKAHKEGKRGEVRKYMYKLQKELRAFLDSNFGEDEDVATL